MNALAEPRVSIRTELVDRSRPTAGTTQSLIYEQVLDGEFTGYQASMTFTLDGDIVIGPDIRLSQIEPTPADAVATSGVLRALRAPDAYRTIELCIENIASVGYEDAVMWLQAFGQRRRRAGRAGNSALVYVQTALHRVEAERRWPGKAIRHMNKTWSELYTSEQSAKNKVNRAKAAGYLRFDGRTPVLTDAALAIINGGND